jgi:hypothetical protein
LDAAATGVDPRPALAYRPVASVGVRRCARLLRSRAGAAPDDCKGDEAFVRAGRDRRDS